MVKLFLSLVLVFIASQAVAQQVMIDPVRRDPLDKAYLQAGVETVTGTTIIAGTLPGDRIISGDIGLTELDLVALDLRYYELGTDLDLQNKALLDVDWASSDDGAGSGLDADTVDGLHSSSFEAAGTAVSLVTAYSNFVEATYLKISFSNFVDLTYLNKSFSNYVDLTYLNKSYSNHVDLTYMNKSYSNYVDETFWFIGTNVPATESDAAVTNTLVADAGFLYVCRTNDWGGVGTNWLRATLSGF